MGRICPSLQGLRSRLSDVQKYLADVAAGKLPVNHQIVYHLQDVFNLLPDLEDPAVTSSFISNTNDQLLVVYLSSLVRAVIALHALVDNKAANGRAELEEGKGDEKTKKPTKADKLEPAKAGTDANSKGGEKPK